MGTLILTAIAAASIVMNIILLALLARTKKNIESSYSLGQITAYTEIISLLTRYLEKDAGKTVREDN